MLVYSTVDDVVARTSILTRSIQTWVSVYTHDVTNELYNARIILMHIFIVHLNKVDQLRLIIVLKKNMCIVDFIRN